MNCTKTERQILLEQAGELSEGKRRRLLKHIRACENCRQYREDVLRVTAAAKESAPQAEVSAFALERIRRAAIERVGGHRRPRAPAPPFVVLWRPALAAAAVAALLFAAWLAVWPRVQVPGDATQQAATAPPPRRAAPAVDTAWNGDFDEKIVELDVMLAMVSGDSSSAVSYEEDLGSTDTDSIARELLELEGSS